jgi:hypothetical protein
MKYICFGYYDKGKFDGMTEAQRLVGDMSEIMKASEQRRRKSTVR